MKKCLSVFFSSMFIFFILNMNVWAQTLPTSLEHGPDEVKTLFYLFKKNSNSMEFTKKLKNKTLVLKSKAVPVLIEVMKQGEFPDRNRWLATFLLGRIMGRKSGPFIARFLEHPHWLMRLAALKTLMSLSLKEYAPKFALALKDQSLLVRRQALENINYLQLDEAGPDVWGMLFDKTNYSSDHQGKLKRTSILKTAIRTLGNLKFQKVKKDMAKMIQKKKYEDIQDDLDYSLLKITGKKSPKKMGDKIAFWKKEAKTI